jgi:integrase
LASLPEVLTDTEIDELLRSFDQPFPSHRRAYAMTRCLIDLGLRCSEVVGLRLEDIDWADGTISLTGTKGRRADVLPLPAATGCVFRGDAPTDSDLMRPPVPISSAHRFRGMRPPL